MDKLKQRIFNRKTTIIAVVFLYWIGLYLYGATLPVYVQSKVSDLAVVGTILSMYGLWQAIVRLPVGILSDWMGRRKPDVIIGLVIVAAGAYGLGQADDAAALTFTRALVGIGAGTWVPLLVLFNSFYKPEEAFRATGLITLISTLTRMLATGLNGPINSLSGGYQAAFNLAAVAALAAIVLMLFVREQPEPPRRPHLPTLTKLFLRPDVLGPALLNLVLHYADWGATFSFIPILARTRFEAGDVTISILTSVNLGVVAAGNFLVTWLGKRLPYRGLLAISFGLACAGLGLAAAAPTLAWLVVAQLVLALGFGIAYPVLLAACIRHVDGSQRASAMGLNQATYAVGMFAGPWLSGILAAAIRIQPMFALTAVFVFLAGLGGVRVLREK